MDRIAAGVEVRILNDLVGCWAYSKAELNALRDAGAHVGYDISQLARVNYRNHRKITVVDSEIGHSGGFNIGQEYIDGGKKYPAWRDTGIRITGPGRRRPREAVRHALVRGVRRGPVQARVLPGQLARRTARSWCRRCTRATTTGGTR